MDRGGTNTSEEGVLSPKTKVRKGRTTVNDIKKVTTGRSERKTDGGTHIEHPWTRKK